MGKGIIVYLAALTQQKLKDYIIDLPTCRDSI
jgi:hypothetical protein